KGRDRRFTLGGRRGRFARSRDDKFGSCLETARDSSGAGWLNGGYGSGERRTVRPRGEADGLVGVKSSRDRLAAANRAATVRERLFENRTNFGERHHARYGISRGCDRRSGGRSARCSERRDLLGKR